MEQKITYLILFFSGMLIHTIFDAARDGWVFDNLFGDKKTYFVDEYLWHPFKNISRLGIAVAFFSISKIETIPRIVLIFILFSPVLWVIWQIAYNVFRFGKPFQKYNLNITKFIPFLYRNGKQDFIVSFSKNETIGISLIVMSLSIILIHIIY